MASVELITALTSADLTNANLELTETLANLSSAGGLLLAFFGSIFGGTVVTAIASIIAMGAAIGSNHLRSQIDLERGMRGTTSAPITTTTTTTTTLDPGTFYIQYSKLI